MTDRDAREKLAARLRAHLERPEYPLSYPQQRPWFLDQLQKHSTVYNLPMAYRVRGPLDVAALREALTEVTRRHEVLRSVYRTVGGAPKQIVQPAREVELVEVDVSAEADPERAAAELAVAEARTPFDLTAGPMLRVKLARIAPDDRLLLLTLHHISCDAWSVGIIAREASALYAARLAGAPAQLPPLKLQYVDFTDWQAKALHGAARHELMRYWRDKLAGIPASINLPTDRPRPPVQDYSGGHVFLELPAELVAAVDALARRSEATPFAVLMAAFAALLARHTGEDDVVIGTPVANRHQLELESLVGFFTNTLVFRPDLSGAPSFGELVRRVGAETRANLAHQDLPFEIVVEELRPDRNPAHSPVFQVMFIYWDADDSALWSLPGCTVTADPGDSATAKFDLTLSLTRSGDVIRARFEFATSLYDEETIARMARQYETLLGHAVADPAAPARTLRILPEDQRRQLVEQWGRGAELAPATAMTAAFAPALIAAQVVRTPAAPAVLDLERELTYQQLDERAGALASALTARGVGRGSTVGVYLDRSVETVVALVCILRAGAAYLPLDPGYPAERLAFMCSDSGARVVVSRRGVARPAQELGAEVLWLDDVAAVAGASAPLPALDPDDLAYVIYTSGSTGKPKGVMVTHRNVATFFAAMDESFRGEPAGTWLAVTSISFDISVLELLWTLTRGFRVAIRSDEPRADEASRAAAADVAPAPVPGRAAVPEVRTPDFSLFYFGRHDRTISLPGRGIRCAAGAAGRGTASGLTMSGAWPVFIARSPRSPAWRISPRDKRRQTRF
jgi:non-ribosomal peptide synthetase component F